MRARRDVGSQVPSGRTRSSASPCAYWHCAPFRHWPRLLRKNEQSELSKNPLRSPAAGPASAIAFQQPGRAGRQQTARAAEGRSGPASSEGQTEEASGLRSPLLPAPLLALDPPKRAGWCDAADHLARLPKAQRE